MTFTRLLRSFTLVGFVLVVGLLAANEGCSHYEFGIAKRDNPSYFPPVLNLNRTVSYNHEYSWLTDLPVGDTTIETEHGGVATWEDLEPLGLSPGRYLFTSLLIRGTAVTSVQREYHYGDERLEAVGGYLYRPRRLATGETDPSHPDWERILIHAFPQQEPGPFRVIWIYKLPEQARMAWYLPRALWFDQSLVEHLVVTQTQQGVTTTHEFTLENHWHKCSTVWWERMLAV